jgi:hypothetical protein
MARNSRTPLEMGLTVAGAKMLRAGVSREKSRLVPPATVSGRKGQ